MYRDSTIVAVLIVVLGGACLTFLRVRKKKKQKAETPHVPEQERTNRVTQEAINEGTVAQLTEATGEKPKRKMESGGGLLNFFKRKCRRPAE